MLREQWGAESGCVLNVYTSTGYAPADWPHWQWFIGLRLAQGVSGAFLRFNPGSNAGLRIPAVDLAVSEFG